VAVYLDRKEKERMALICERKKRKALGEKRRRWPEATTGKKRKISPWPLPAGKRGGGKRKRKRTRFFEAPAGTELDRVLERVGEKVLPYAYKPKSEKEG